MFVHHRSNELSGAGALPPLFIITATDHGGYVCVVLYIMLILMLLLVMTRISTRWFIIKFIKLDDIFLILAAALGLAESIFVQLAVNHGLGRTVLSVSEADFVLFEKYIYASQILLVAAMAAAKISLSLLIQGLLVEGMSLIASRGLLGIIVAWALTSIVALSFGCSLPSPWEMTVKNCINLPALHIFIAALNIGTDALLVLLPCLVFWKVHDHTRRFRVVALFASRFIVCVAAGVQLRYCTRSLHSTDPTWASINSSISDQVMMNLSIISTAIPSLGRLIIELQPEVNAFAITEQHGRLTDKYTLSAFGHKFPNSFVVGNKLGGHTSVTRSRTNDSESLQPLREDGVKQNKNTIKQTVGFEVSSYTLERDD